MLKKKSILNQITIKTQFKDHIINTQSNFLDFLFANLVMLFSVIVDLSQDFNSFNKEELLSADAVDIGRVTKICKQFLTVGNILKIMSCI